MDGDDSTLSFGTSSCSTNYLEWDSPTFTVGSGLNISVCAVPSFANGTGTKVCTSYTS